MSGNAHPSTRVVGSLRSADGAGFVRVEDRYDTDIEDLWDAITDPARLARWHGQVEGDLRPGGAFRMYIASNDIESTGRVEACEPPRRLLVTNRETDESYRKGQGVAPFDASIEALLTPDGDQTVLSPPISPVGTPATSKPAGKRSSLPTRSSRRRWSDGRLLANAGPAGERVSVEDDRRAAADVDRAALALLREHRVHGRA